MNRSANQLATDRALFISNNNDIDASSELLSPNPPIEPTDESFSDIFNSPELDNDVDDLNSNDNPCHRIDVLTDDDDDNDDLVHDGYTLNDHIQIEFGLDEDDIGSDNCLPKVSKEDILQLDTTGRAMLDLIQLCQKAGTSIEFFDNLVTTLRRHGKKGFDITKATKRQTFLSMLRKQISSPRPEICKVGSNLVPRFDFGTQLKDLLSSSLLDDLENLCVNSLPDNRYTMYIPTDNDSFIEVCSGQWYKDTYSQFITDPQSEFLLPIILY